MSKPYENFTNDEMILRDHLAIDRTALANERTLLAYIRTALALAIAGASALHFLDALQWVIAGWLLIVGAALTLIFGLRRYLLIKMAISRSQSSKN